MRDHVADFLIAGIEGGDQGVGELQLVFGGLGGAAVVVLEAGVAGISGRVVFGGVAVGGGKRGAAAPKSPGRRIGCRIAAKR